MRVAAITGKERAGLVEKPDPHAKGEFVVVKVLVAPMCTEYKAFKNGNPSDNLGHEAAGEVVEVAQAGTVKVGDRVVVMPLYACGCCALCLRGDYIHCRNTLDPLRATGNTTGTATYAQYLVKQDWMLLPIPQEMSTEHASLTCCGLGPTFGAMQRMAVDAFDTVLITGMGPVGLGGVINAVSRGARVIAVEGHPYRANLAKELGAAVAVNPTDKEALRQILDMTDGQGVDKAVDCTGVAAAQRLLIDATRRRGHVAFVGEGGDVPVNVSNDLIRKGLTLHGVWHWNRGDSARILQVVAKSAKLLDKFITHTFPLSQVEDAWKLQLTGHCGKVLLYPWQ
ncbi:MAG: zinc-binding dehydrogenase [Planctomycetes bacterium]|nr:zinc-binding dehydrogenase [Planctomycetota bacterium]